MKAQEKLLLERIAALEERVDSLKAAVSAQADTIDEQRAEIIRLCREAGELEAFLAEAEERLQWEY